MGTRNRQRRREKQRKQASRQHHRPQPNTRRGRAGWQPGADRGLLEAVVVAAAEAFADDDGPGYAHLLDMLDEGPPVPDGRPAVDACVVFCLESAVTTAWRRGWQPADLPRLARRRLTGRHEALVIDAVAGEARQYAAATLGPAWADQLDAVGATRWWDPQRPYLDQRATASGVTRRDALMLAVETLSLLILLPDLPHLCPLPGSAGASTRGDRVRSAVDGRLLERVRALLAKAESTTFPDEAEALSAKAQELMARHAIDQAMLDSIAGGSRGSVVGRRIAVDDPYAAAKALLLDNVADANRCRAVWTTDLGFSTVLGAGSDLDGVELLFTSLLRQATAAMLGHGKQRQRARSAAFRRSFLLGYATRIGARLAEGTAAATAEAAEVHGDRLLPVLAERASAVDEAVDEAFPGMTARRFSVGDYAGWAAGQVAADLATLGQRAEIAGA